MSYIKIKGEEEHYKEDIMQFTSQHGKKAIRFIGDIIPTTNKGFEYYSDDDILISDLSDYIYEYKQNEYTIEEDTIEEPQPNNESLNSYSDAITQRLNQLNDKINDITPYEETKIAYYGENEKVFYNVPEGIVSVFFSNYEGDYELERFPNRLVLTFYEEVEQEGEKVKQKKRLTDMTDITIMIQ